MNKTFVYSKIVSLAFNTLNFPTVKTYMKHDLHYVVKFLPSSC